MLVDGFKKNHAKYVYHLVHVLSIKQQGVRLKGLDDLLPPSLMKTIFIPKLLLFPCLMNPRCAII